MFYPLTLKVFARRDVLFHEHVDECQKKESHGVWNIPNDNVESAKEEDIEQVQYEYLRSMDTSSSQISPRRDEGTPWRKTRGEGNPQINVAPRRST